MDEDHHPNPGFTDVEFDFLKEAKEHFHQEEMAGMGQVSWAQFFIHCSETELDKDFVEYKKEHENKDVYE